ncbi:MAG TPA: hypothetical protein VD866_25480 [Urbifossiella sp.]|nr:hypothetical protein [Urbifossiella sp.]
MLLAVSLGALGMTGCGKAAPAVLKVIAGGGAKVAPKAAAHVAPAAAAPAARAGGAAGRVGQEGAQQAVQFGAGQLTGDDKRRR